MKRCNDFSLGINQPTIEKLEKFHKDRHGMCGSHLVWCYYPLNLCRLYPPGPVTKRESHARPKQKPAPKDSGGGLLSLFAWK